MSCALVAVTVTLPGDEGAVNAPLELMAPAVTAQVTAESSVPVPCTVALHWELAPGATDGGVHATATEETCEETGWLGEELELPPQAMHASMAADARRRRTAEGPERVFCERIFSWLSGIQRHRAH